ncbi:MAG TPA: metallophosphoesterase [Pyrinomonadaceae bacterium]|jgi:hypothetical protein
MESGVPQTTDPRRQLDNELTLKLSFLGAIKFLEASEYALIQLMVDNEIWIGPVPENPGGSGDVEWGLLPYWVHHPPAFILDYIQSHETLNLAWKGLEAILPARIDSANYDALLKRVEQAGLVATDGTIFGTGQYEQIDLRWLFSLVNYLIVVTSGDVAPFSNKQVAPVPLEGVQGRVKIALVGDWGTGAFKNGEAVGVMQQIMSLKPDYLIHLGDVYYAGTAGDFLPLNEEMNNFLNDWPDTSQLPAGNSFMLNSNHEMYSGAKGYFDVGLADERFNRQQGTSYFALQYAGWTILGLDSAYYSPSALFMAGDLGTNGVQSDWIRGLNLDPDRVIVLTHHNGLSYDGSVEFTPFWDQINEALNGDPAAWYWGHVHNGVAYKSPTVTDRKTLARCVGHGAIPYGDQFGTAGSGRVDYYAHTPAPAPPRVLNGFALLTIDSNGVVTEEFYELGLTGAKYSNQYG